MDSSIKEIQRLLDDTARECLRYVATHDLAPAHYQRLGRFIFGCMNQKHNLPARVKRRGRGELKKVMRFAALASQVLAEIDAEQSQK